MNTPDRYDNSTPVPLRIVFHHGKVAEPLLSKAARLPDLGEPQHMPIASDGLPARSSGAWVLDKKAIFEKYCGIFSKGVSAKWGGKLAFVDLFCGPGKNVIRGSGAEIDGSPLLALRNEFARYVFVDSPEIISTLKARLTSHPKLDRIAFIEGDCNKILGKVLQNLPNDHLTLAFIDPTGFHVEFETIRRLVSGRKIDLLMTIQFGMALNMNLPQYINTEGEALTAFLGNTDWRKDVEQSGTVEQASRRILDRYMNQIRSLGYLDTKDKEIVRNDQGTPLYSIVMASRHELGNKFWKEINKIGPSGQRDFSF
jgi:three-Cys-motif partner protein